jgi:ribonuclease HI
VLRLHFPASNNVAEYEALVNGLRIAIELGVRRLDARGDSQLVVGAKAKTPPFARGLRCSRWSDRDKTGRDTLRRFGTR